MLSHNKQHRKRPQLLNLISFYMLGPKVVYHSSDKQRVGFFHICCTILSHSIPLNFKTFQNHFTQGCHCNGNVTCKMWQRDKLWFCSDFSVALSKLTNTQHHHRQRPHGTKGDFHDCNHGAPTYERRFI